MPNEHLTRYVEMMRKLRGQVKYEMLITHFFKVNQHSKALSILRTVVDNE